MIKGIGVDLVQINRPALKNEKLALKVLTPKEYAIYQNLDGQQKLEFFAGRFAAKEAYYKAKNDKSIGYHDFEVLNADDGRPITNDKNILISISHERDYVVAFVIIKE